jgi:cytochrome c
MRRRVKFVASLALAAAVAACSGEKRDEPASEASPSAPPALPVPASAPAAAVAAPPAAFFQCRSCHSVEPGKNGIGPTLAGIVGSKAGEVPGFAFSKALKDSGITWDRATLDQWLAGPTRMVPGTRMVISVPDPVRRKAIIDYLETLQ